MFFVFSKTVGFITVRSNLIARIELARITLLSTRVACAGRRLETAPRKHMHLSFRQKRKAIF